MIESFIAAIVDMSWSAEIRFAMAVFYLEILIFLGGGIVKADRLTA